jgi:hypothetical protein
MAARFDRSVFVNCPFDEAYRPLLEAQHHRYQAALSDLAGSDIAVHEGNGERLVVAVRNWLNGQCGLKAPGGSRIWGAFLEYWAHSYDRLTQQGFSAREIDDLPVNELIESMPAWARRAT